MIRFRFTFFFSFFLLESFKFLWNIDIPRNISEILVIHTILPQRFCSHGTRYWPPPPLSIFPKKKTPDLSFSYLLRIQNSDSDSHFLLERSRFLWNIDIPQNICGILVVPRILPQRFWPHSLYLWEIVKHPTNGPVCCLFSPKKNLARKYPWPALFPPIFYGYKIANLQQILISSLNYNNYIRQWMWPFMMGKYPLIKGVVPSSVKTLLSILLSRVVTL